MALIRNSDFSSSAKKAVVLDLGDLRRQAELMEQQALTQVRALLHEGRQERERILAGAQEQGYAEGHAQGFEKGMEEGRAAGRAEALADMSTRLLALEAAWKSSLDRFEADRDDILLAAKTEVLAFASAVAERVTKRIVSLDPEVVREQLEVVVGLASRASRLTIRVAPDDLAFATEVLPGIMQRLGNAAHASLQTDSALTRGSVIATTEAGEIDASIETQLDRILLAILPPKTEPAKEDA